MSTTTINIPSLDVVDPELVSAITDMEDAMDEAVGQQVEELAPYDGQRVRVHLAGRKMAVPGRLQETTLHTNWGLELDLSKEIVTQIDVKNVDTGRWVVEATF